MVHRVIHHPVSHINGRPSCFLKRGAVVKDRRKINEIWLELAFKNGRFDFVDWEIILRGQN